MAMSKVLSTWLADSGWTELLSAAGETTMGRAESLLQCSHVTQTRYVHEVTAVCLHIFRHEAYVESHEMSFDDWHKGQSKSSKMYKYWSIVMELEMTLLLFVRSLRDGGFSLYKASLTKMVPWFFALDKYNYAC